MTKKYKLALNIIHIDLEILFDIWKYAIFTRDFRLIQLLRIQFPLLIYNSIIPSTEH